VFTLAKKKGGKEKGTKFYVSLKRGERESEGRGLKSGDKERLESFHLRFPALLREKKGKGRTLDLWLSQGEGREKEKKGGNNHHLIETSESVNGGIELGKKKKSAQTYKQYQKEEKKCSNYI